MEITPQPDSLLATTIFGLLVLALVALIVRKLVRDRRAGKCACGGSCGSCGACKNIQSRFLSNKNQNNNPKTKTTK